MIPTRVKITPKKNIHMRHSDANLQKSFQDYQNSYDRKVTFDGKPEPSVFFRSNRSISKKQVQNPNVLMEKHINESKKLINEVIMLKQDLKNGRKQRKFLLQEMEKFCQNIEHQENHKDKHNLKNSTLIQSIIIFRQEQKTPKFSKFHPVQPVKNYEGRIQNNVLTESFLDSFRVVFTFYIELYFQKASLALKLSEKSYSVLHYLLSFLDKKFEEHQPLVEADDICLAIYRLIRNKDINYRIVDIKYGLKTAVNQNFHWKLSDFNQIFYTQENEAHMEDTSKPMRSMTSQELIKRFFQIFAQFYDTEIKLKKICKANEKKLAHFFHGLSISSELNINFLGEFLYYDIEDSKSWLILRFKEFFRDHFGTKDISINFMKWINDKK